MRSPIAGVVSQREQMRVLGVFNDVNNLAKESDNAPPINKALGTKLPELSSSRSWAIHTEAIDKFPERFALLEKTSREVTESPAFKEAFAKTGAPPEAIRYGNREACNRYVKGMVELTEEYRSLLSAKKG